MVLTHHRPIDCQTNTPTSKHNQRLPNIKSMKGHNSCLINAQLQFIELLMRIQQLPRFIHRKWSYNDKI